MLIQNIFRASLLVFAKSGGPTTKVVNVQCILDSTSLGNVWDATNNSRVTEVDTGANDGDINDIVVSNNSTSQDGVGDTGSCSGFNISCSTNLQTYCNTGFATAIVGQRINDEDIQAFYNTARGVAGNRSFSLPTKAEDIGVTDGARIDDAHHDNLKNWLDGTFGHDNVPALGTIIAQNAGDRIDASDWINLRDKLKNVAECIPYLKSLYLKHKRVLFHLNESTKVMN